MASGKKADCHAAVGRSLSPCHSPLAHCHFLQQIAHGPLVVGVGDHVGMQAAGRLRHIDHLQPLARTSAAEGSRSARQFDAESKKVWLNSV